ncbi:hypothetical protein BD779DRAFT_1442990 [Infundibulicybe gibba]|nr:hypothetical protein BD779DRAFT_1442990 [Infundibulicybe gibba]
MRLLSLATLVVVTPSLVFSVVIPGADTPLFYLVSSSSTASANLLPLRTSSSTGGSTLTGSGPIGKFYFKGGQFVAVDPNGSPEPPNPTLRSLVSSTQVSTATCTTAGALVFVQGSSSNKCAHPAPFSIRSNQENSQLGASLALDPGSFYACGPGLDVWYKGPVDDGPAGCNPISLYTVPVV